MTFKCTMNIRRDDKRAIKSFSFAKWIAEDLLTAFVNWLSNSHEFRCRPLKAFFDQTSELLEDVTVAYGRLLSCSEILILVSNASSDATKQEVKQLMKKIKKVNYDLRKFISQVDPVKGPDQFNHLTEIYGAGEKNVDLYDHNYWRVKVFYACKKLNRLPRLPPVKKDVNKCKLFKIKS